MPPSHGSGTEPAIRGGVPFPFRRRRSAPAGPTISVQDLTRTYGNLVAVNGISMEVHPGTIVGVIGPSGSGKTTLIRMLTGTLDPSSGSARVLGEEPKRFGRHTRERIGYMPQLFVLYPDLTVAENVSFVASLFGLLWRRRHRRVREVLELVELWDVRRRQAKDLSGGMQRRLELACALVHEPSLCFFDEPTAGLDPVLRQKLWQEFRRLSTEGRTLLVTTQYVAEAEYCDVVAVIADGRLVALEDPESLRRSALGGEIIEIETVRPVDATALGPLKGVIEVRQAGPRRLHVVSQDAAAVTPRLLESLAAEGVEVASSGEYHPTFDEVFAELVKRKTAQADEQVRRARLLEGEEQPAARAA